MLASSSSATAPPTPDPTDLEPLAIALGHRFRDGRLLLTAVTHRSFLNEMGAADATDNERLEFLGDAFVDLAAAEHLYRRLPEAQEGVLTALRAALVCKATLARFARQLGLGHYLRLGRGEAAGGGRDRPTILGDTFEAVVGALYLDGGAEAARDLVLRFLEPEAESVLAEQTFQDAKSAFQEQIQQRWHVTPYYATVAEEGPQHERVFVVEVRVGQEVWGVGTGRSKAEAARWAARVALERIEVGAVPQADPATDRHA
jgi:ribonuclease III